MKIFPKTRLERIRVLWALTGGANFLAFLAHIVSDGTTAFPTGGRLVAGQYLVSSHGKDIAFTESGYIFSYAHGVIFIVVHIACMVAFWWLHGRKTNEAPAPPSHPQP